MAFYLTAVKRLLRSLGSSRQRLNDFDLLMRAVVDADGVEAAVRLANTMTEHRYTALYRIDDDQLICRCQWDKAGPSMAHGAVTPVCESFCIHILQDGHGFSVLDALADPRVAGHPKRKEVRSYCGAPLLDGAGQVAGAFCHFDEAPNRVGPTDYEYVHIAAAVLAEQVLGEGKRMAW